MEIKVTFVPRPIAHYCRLIFFYHGQLIFSEYRINAELFKVAPSFTVLNAQKISDIHFTLNISLKLHGHIILQIKSSVIRTHPLALCVCFEQILTKNQFYFITSIIVVIKKNLFHVFIALLRKTKVTPAFETVTLTLVQFHQTLLGFFLNCMYATALDALHSLYSPAPVDSITIIILYCNQSHCSTPTDLTPAYNLIQFVSLNSFFYSFQLSTYNQNYIVYKIDFFLFYSFIH